MPFEPGNEYGKGRPKGALNKKTLTLKPLVEQLAQHNFDLVGYTVSLIPQMEPENQVTLLCKLFDLVFPKKTASDVTLHDAKEVLKGALIERGIDVDSLVEGGEELILDTLSEPV